LRWPAFARSSTPAGLYQVHNPDRTLSVMSDLIDEAYYDHICDVTFHRRPDVTKTNTTYFRPLRAGKVSNVFFVNGSLDPWSALSFKDPGCSGCSRRT
jgi:hypothetical protein